MRLLLDLRTARWILYVYEDICRTLVSSRHFMSINILYFQQLKPDSFSSIPHTDVRIELLMPKVYDEQYVSYFDFIDCNSMHTLKLSSTKADRIQLTNVNAIDEQLSYRRTNRCKRATIMRQQTNYIAIIIIIFQQLSTEWQIVVNATN